jgi:hypothetical protein
MHSTGDGRPSITLDGEFRMRVVGNDEFDVVCNLEQRVNPTRLIVRLSQPVAGGSCIRIDCEDALLLGEVLGSWRQDLSIFAAIQFQQVLAGLTQLRSVCDDRCSGAEPWQETEYALSA